MLPDEMLSLAPQFTRVQGEVVRTLGHAGAERPCLSAERMARPAPLLASFIDRGPQQRFRGLFDMFDAALQGLFVAGCRGGFAFHDGSPRDEPIIRPFAPMQLTCIKQVAFAHVGWMSRNT